MEQFLSECEHGVTYNFSESGVHPMSYGELIELADIGLEELLAQRVDYPQVNGNELLRDRIAALYDAATASNVLVTVGATEANTLVANTLLESGDNLVCFSPTYEQLAGNAHNRGFEVRWVPQREDDDWAIDLNALASAVDSDTRLIHVVNPNNPTGRILSQDQRAVLIEQARRVGAWIVADEVYAGTERDTDTPTPSFWGCYERVIAINSTSKAYGLPGLRLGWLLAPDSLIDSLWRRHEYASISASDMSMRLTSAALVPEVRAKLTLRARTLIRRGFDTLASSIATRPEIFSVVPPQASAMSFVRFQLPIRSEELVKRLLHEEDMLVVPGAHFGRENYFRFSSALPEAHLKKGLTKLHTLTDRILGEAGV